MGYCVIVDVGYNYENPSEQITGLTDLKSAWPDVKFSSNKLYLGETFKKLLSITLLKPSMHVDNELNKFDSPAQFAICYFTQSYVKDNVVLKKSSSFYECIDASFDDRNVESLKKMEGAVGGGS